MPRFADRYRRLVLWLLSIALLQLASPAWAQQKTLYLGHAAPPNSQTEPAAAMAMAFKAEIDAASKGTLRVEIFPDGQLGGNRDMAELADKNIIQAAIVTVGGVVGRYPPLAVTEIPFAFDRLETAYAVLDGPFGQRLAADFATRTGLQILGFGDTGGFFVITNSKREIHGPADLRGLTIRSIPGFEALNVMIRALGANPVPLASREEAAGLRAGVLDGSMNPISVVLDQHYDDSQKYMTVTNHIYVSGLLVINRQFMRDLTEEQQALVQAASSRAVLAGRATMAGLAGRARGLAAAENRMQVYRPNPAEQAAFKTAMQEPVQDWLREQLGPNDAHWVTDLAAAAEAASGLPSPMP